MSIGMAEKCKDISKDRQEVETSSRNNSAIDCRDFDAYLGLFRWIGGHGAWQRDGDKRVFDFFFPYCMSISPIT